MKILALEFSSVERSVALVDGDAREIRLIASVAEQGPRGVNGMVLVDRALASTGTSPGDVEVVAVGLGPGSYQGIRSAIAIGQGWQLARETRLLGIPSVDVLAADAQLANVLGKVNILIDAQRGEFYRASFHITETEISLATPLQIVTLASLAAEKTNVGPGISKLLPGGRDLFPAASTLARLAARRTDFVRGEQLEPIYLRPTTFLKAAPPRFAKL